MLYQAYGLTFKSDITLPELLEDTSKNQHDVTIRQGKVPASLSTDAYHNKNRSWQAEPGKFLIHIHGIASYQVIGGKEIIVQKNPKATDNDVRVFLLGSPIGALLHQRQLLVLHASAVDTGNGAAVFIGNSGSGKSTMLSALMQEGYAMLTDDILAIEQGNNGIYLAAPAFPQSKLWPDSARELAIDTQDLPTVRTKLQKYYAPIPKFCNHKSAISTFYLLSSNNTDQVSINPVTAEEQFSWLVRHTYRKKFVYGFQQQAAHFEFISKMLGTTSMYEIQRPQHEFQLNRMVSLLTDDWSL